MKFKIFFVFMVLQFFSLQAHPSEVVVSDTLWGEVHSRLNSEDAEKFAQLLEESTTRQRAGELYSFLEEIKRHHIYENSNILWSHLVRVQNSIESAYPGTRSRYQNERGGEIQLRARNQCLASLHLQTDSNRIKQMTASLPAVLRALHDSPQVLAMHRTRLEQIFSNSRLRREDGYAGLYSRENIESVFTTSTGAINNTAIQELTTLLNDMRSNISQTGRTHRFEEEDLFIDAIGGALSESRPSLTLTQSRNLQSCINSYLSPSTTEGHDELNRELTNESAAEAQ